MDRWEKLKEWIRENRDEALVNYMRSTKHHTQKGDEAWNQIRVTCNDVLEMMGTLERETPPEARMIEGESRQFKAMCQMGRKAMDAFEKAGIKDSIVILNDGGEVKSINDFNFYARGKNYRLLECTVCFIDWMIKQYDCFAPETKREWEEFCIHLDADVKEAYQQHLNRTGKGNRDKRK